MSEGEHPAVVIRRAAALIRKRGGVIGLRVPWRCEGRDVTTTLEFNEDGSPDWDWGFRVAACPSQDYAEWIEVMSPGFGGAVAAWLEAVAENAARGLPDGDGTVRAALQVARTCLVAGRG